MGQAASVAVCVPAYQPKTQYLQDLVRSIANQTRPVDEIIVRVDPSDAPVKDQQRRQMDLATIDFLGIPHRVIWGSERLGMAGNWNATVAASDSDYFILPGQDDMLAPQAVSSHLQNLDRTGASISCSDRQYVDADGAPRRTAQRSVRSSRIFNVSGTYALDSCALLRLTLMYGNIMGEPCGTMVSRQAFDAVDGYNTSLRHGADVDFTLRVAQSTGLCTYTTRVLSYCRLHSENETITNIREGYSARERAWLLNRFGQDLDAPTRRRAEARVFTHAVYDAWRAQGISGLRGAWRGAVGMNALALTREIAEILGWPPSGRRVVQGCGLWPS